MDSPATELCYVTVKAGDFAEVNSFESVMGSVPADGAAQANDCGLACWFPSRAKPA